MESVDHGYNFVVFIRPSRDRVVLRRSGPDGFGRGAVEGTWALSRLGREAAVGAATKRARAVSSVPEWTRVEVVEETEEECAARDERERKPAGEPEPPEKTAASYFLGGAGWTGGRVVKKDIHGFYD